MERVRGAGAFRMVKKYTCSPRHYFFFFYLISGVHLAKFQDASRSGGGDVPTAVFPWKNLDWSSEKAKAIQNTE